MLVVGVQVPHAHLGEEAVALEHLYHGPLQRTCRLLRVGDHRNVEVRDAVVDPQLHHLRVDHDKADLIGAGLVQQAQDQGVHAHGFTGAGGTGNKHVGQLCDVAHDAVAADVLADGKAELGLGILELGRFDDIPQIHGTHQFVGNLDAHGGDLVRDRRNAHIHNTKSQGQVPRQVGDAGELHALLQFNVIAGDGRSVGHAHNGGVDAKAGQRALEALRVELDLVPGVHSPAHAAAQQLHRRELVIGPILRVGDLLRHGLGLFRQFLFLHLLGRILDHSRGRHRLPGRFGLGRHGDLGLGHSSSLGNDRIAVLRVLLHRVLIHGDLEGLHSGGRPFLCLSPHSGLFRRTLRPSRPGGAAQAQSLLVLVLSQGNVHRIGRSAASGGSLPDFRGGTLLRAA